MAHRNLQVAAYHGQLLRSPVAREYLFGRGLTLNTITRARLGYVERPVPGHERFAGAIAIPYFDGREELRHFRFRYIDGRQQKYDQERGKTIHLYNPEASLASHVYLTEGEFDSLVLRQLSLAAMAIPGTLGWRREWRWMFRDCDRVSIVFDVDANQAGQKASARVAGHLAQVTHVHIVRLPQGLDVTDMYLQAPTELQEALRWRD